MNDIFNNLYKKVLSFFASDKSDKESARESASNRLKLVLMQDRSNLDGATMQKMREQLITVISKYIEIDTEALDLNLEGDGDEIALMLNIPVIKARSQEEIEELEKAEEEARKEEIRAAIEAEKAQQQEEKNKDSEENKEDSENEESENENEASSTEETDSEDLMDEESQPTEEKSEPKKEKTKKDSE